MKHQITFLKIHQHHPLLKSVPPPLQREHGVNSFHSLGSIYLVALFVSRNRISVGGRKSSKWKSLKPQRIKANCDMVLWRETSNPARPALAKTFTATLGHLTADIRPAHQTDQASRGSGARYDWPVTCGPTATKLWLNYWYSGVGALCKWGHEREPTWEWSANFIWKPQGTFLPVKTKHIDICV